MVWEPVVSLLHFQTPELDGKGLRDTLRRKDLVRVLNLLDLVLRLDPASELALEVRPPLEAHVAAGNAPETHA